MTSLSPETRRLIDEAVASGRFTRIPAGMRADSAPIPRPKRGRPRKNGETLSELKARRATKAAGKIADRRRFKVSPVPSGTTRVIVAADTPGTIFSTRIATPASGDRVLKDGASSCKIGGDVHKGRLRGARIYTLTLEERATCPRSCGLWQACYGNAMPHPTRWQRGPELERAVAEEVAALCAPGDPVLIRLHILGDFYSFDYLRLWVALLDDHPNLNVFGFTAWPPGTHIGDGIARVRAALGRRFSIRHSGRTGPWGSFTINFPTERPRLGDAVVCPEQAEAMNGRQGRHCGNCCLCWQSDLPIVFVEH
ncbi:hypothetical protein [Neotabrizicola sp. sgz301269]|uniref:hypothetical protein n=1 Tax=Neotabrizicola sp. sgz301269 TaxID=3276282 RepID=UPI00376FD64A